MQHAVSLQTLFDTCKDALQLRWLSGQQAAENTLAQSGDEGEEALVAHLNFIHPHRVQLLGSAELDYLQKLDDEALQQAMSQLISPPTQLLILAGDSAPPDVLLHYAKDRDFPLWHSPLDSHRLGRNIDYYLQQLLADTLVVHGVFMEVMGIGVLLTGKSAIGKSELALELISRGHRLVADDAPAFQRHGPDRIIGHCPEALRHFLEVRGLGIMNVRELFGDNAIRPHMRLHLIVQLTPFNEIVLEEEDRLSGSRRNRMLLDVSVPEVILPVAPGRNLAVLVEAAARNQILYNRGYDAAEDFIRRQRNLINSDTP